MVPHSVRLRLTLWYSASLAAIVLSFALGIYLFVRSSLLQEIDNQLDKDLAIVTRVLREEPFEINELAQHGSVDLFQLREGNDVVAETGAWSRSGLEKALSTMDRALPRSWESPNEQHYRLKVLSFAVPGHRYLIAAAEDEQTLRTSLKSLGIVLLLGIPVALALAIAGGFFLAGRALSPLGIMAAKAGEITAERLSERLPVENPDDEFGRLATVFNDAFRRLEDSFERLRRFTADASHELRTPLTAIRSVGEVGLQKQLDPVASREVIASMLEEADRLTKLVDGLLVLSRADAGSVQLSCVRTDLSALTAEVVDFLGVLAEEKEQSIVFENKGMVCADIDPAAVRQAIVNLVDNAIKYSPEKGQIRITVERKSADAVIEVADDGVGIPKDQQDKVFERFFRVDTGRSREMGGTGLGLAIALWAVKASGGRIELESEEGRGSTFRIVIPAAGSSR